MDIMKSSLAIISFFLFIMTPEVYASNIAKLYRFSDHEHHARFVVECESVPEFDISTLSNPDRLIVDIKHTLLQLLPPGDGVESHIVSGIRHSMHTPEHARIVLDLKKPITVTKSTVLPPVSPGGNYRLMVDMEPIKAAAKIAQATETPPPIVKPPAIQKLKTIAEKKEATTKPKRYRRPVIILDPGHGGKDSGAVGRYRKIYEKHVTLTYAKSLKQKLMETMDCDVYLTRSRDIYIPLQERVRIGRKHRGDLMISIHADSHPNPHTKGLSIYTLSDHASDKEAAALANRENKHDIIHNVDFSNKSEDLTAVLIDLVQRESRNKSADFAEFVVKELEQKVHFLQNTHRFAGFRVLKGSDIPSVLIELGYLSNREEEKQLMNPIYRDKIVTALSKAIYQHFTKHKPIS